MLNTISKVYFYCRFHEKILDIEAELHGSITKLLGSYACMAGAGAISFLGQSLIVMRQFVASLWPLSESTQAQHAAALAIFNKESLLERVISEALEDVQEEQDAHNDNQAEEQEDPERANEIALERQIEKLTQKSQLLRDSYRSVSSFYGPAPLQLIEKLDEKQNVVSELYQATKAASWEHLSKIASDKNLLGFFINTIELPTVAESTDEAKIGILNTLFAALTQEEIKVDTFIQSRQALKSDENLDLTELSESEHAIYELYNDNVRAEPVTENNHREPMLPPEENELQFLSNEQMSLLKTCYEDYAQSKDPNDIAVSLLENQAIKDLIQRTPAPTDEEILKMVNQIIFKDALKDYANTLQSETSHTEAVTLKTSLSVISSLIFDEMRRERESENLGAATPAVTFTNPNPMGDNPPLSQEEAFFNTLIERLIASCDNLKLFKQGHETYKGLRREISKINPTTLQEYFADFFTKQSYISLETIADELEAELRQRNQCSSTWDSAAFIANKRNFVEKTGADYERFLQSYTQHILNTPALRNCNTPALRN